MGIFNIFGRRKTSPTEDQRRDVLLRHGRIAEGVIIDAETKKNGDEVVYYVYSVNGVDFESSETLTELQRQNILNYSPGAKVSIRYDPKNHGNCILV